ncbi:MAG: hypothetical protein JWQ40_4791 [Segetibacter sp.]|nr:hypothetical protein [Segetibacter sp.]
MKMTSTRTRLFAMIVVCTALLQSCLKDTATRTYTMYTPVYKSVAEVRSDIKIDASTPVINPGKIFVLGKYIFLNEVDKGVHVIDNTNPASPVNKYFIAIPGNLDLAVKGNILYADLYRDLVTIDISDPADVRVKKIIENVFPRRQYLNGFWADSTRIIVDWIKKDTTVRADQNNFVFDSRSMFSFNSTQGAMASAAVTRGISGSMARFTLLNNYLYTVTNSNLNVFNISQPENPVFTNTVPVGWEIETIYPFKNNLFIGSQTGMFIYNTDNPSTPTKVSVFSHLRVCDPVIADDDFAYVTLRSGTRCQGFQNQLDIVAIQNLQAPTLIKSYPLTNPHGLSKDGNTLFICDGDAGLKVFDAAKATGLKLLKTIGGITAYDVITQNNIAMVVATDGLYQYDYSNLANITLKSKISYK